MRKINSSEVAERYRKIVMWHDEYKQSFAEIGLILGITKQRAHAIYHNAEMRFYIQRLTKREPNEGNAKSVDADG